MKESSTLGVGEEKVLRAANRYHYVTVEEILRAGEYSGGSRTLVQTNVKKLLEMRYLERRPLSNPALAGSAPPVYNLTARGANYLVSLGVEVQARYRRSKGRRSDLLLRHTLLVNDFLLAAEELARKHPEIKVRRAMHELVLARTPLEVEHLEGEAGKVRFAPDAFLELEVPFRGRKWQVCLLYEADRGTVEEKKWKGKVESLVRLKREEYVKRFGVEAMQVVALTTAGEARLRQLVAWTESELRRLHENEGIGERRWGAFYLGALDPGRESAERVFLEPIYRKPFEREAAALLSYEPL